MCMTLTRTTRSEDTFGFKGSLDVTDSGVLTFTLLGRGFAQGNIRWFRRMDVVEYSFTPQLPTESIAFAPRLVIQIVKAQRIHKSGFSIY